MLIKRVWDKYNWNIHERYYYKGYFLFGFIPIFISRRNTKPYD